MTLLELKTILIKNNKPTGIRKKHLVDLGIYQEVLNHTKFLPETYDLRERLYSLLNDIVNKPVCRECGIDTHLDKNSPKRGFLVYCSKECFSLNKGKDGAAVMKTLASDPKFKAEHAEKIRSGIFDSLGVDNAMHVPELAQRRRETSIQKYGADWALSLPETQAKIEATNLARYGFRRPNQREDIQLVALANAKVTWAKNWEEGHPFANEEIRAMARATMIENYGVTNAGYLNNFRSKAEKEINEYINSLGVETIPTYRSFGVEIDIYIPGLNIGIEYHGVYFHSSVIGEDDKNRHLNKQKVLRSKGVRLVQIWEDDWQYDKDKVKRFIKNLIGKNDTKLNARSGKVSALTREEYQTFLDIHHMQSANEASIRIGIKIADDIVAVMGFSKADQKGRRHGVENGSYELVRFASVGVRGAFSKLLKHFETAYNPRMISSYADLEIVNPDTNVYSINGFELAEVLDPDYKYLINGRRKHKFGFRSDRLAAKGIDIEDLSERDAMKQMGVRITWDTGKQLYLKRYGETT